MLRPVITVGEQNGRYTVQVVGRFGGGYTSPGHSAEEAAAMVMRDAPKYDCGDEPLSLALPPAVATCIEEGLARGAKLAACLGCKHRIG